MRNLKIWTGVAALILLSTACGGSDSVDPEDVSAEIAEVLGGGDDPGANPLCPNRDSANAPPAFPYDKPPSMYALAYEEPEQRGSYTIRGVTMDPQAVENELMSVIFPDASFTVVSDRAGAEAYDFVSSLGSGDFFFVAAGDCTNVQINLRMGGDGAGASEGNGETTASDTAGDAVAGATSDDASSTTNESGASGVSGAEVRIVSVDGSFSPTILVCRINSTTIEIIASGDGDLVVTGNDREVMLNFVPPAGQPVTTTEATFGNGAGAWQFISSSGLVIEASGCDS